MGKINNKSMRYKALEEISDLISVFQNGETVYTINEKEFFENLQKYIQKGLSEDLKCLPNEDIPEYKLRENLKELQFWLSSYHTGKMINFEHHISEIIQTINKFERVTIND